MALKKDEKRATFVRSCSEAKNYPILKNDDGTILPEIAVVGRSNVGKSSLLNDLFEQPGLVKTSSTPGKTKLINFFVIENMATFVDLPGYGYSEASRATQKGFQKMVTEYFEKRQELVMVLLLFDIRRDPTDEDIHCLHWLVEENLNPVVILTKVDKIGTTKRLGRKNEIVKAFKVPHLTYLTYSTLKSIGQKELWHVIEEVL